GAEIVLDQQKAPSAAARLANLPVVRSACARLSVLYTGTKSRHPGLKSACEVLESSVTAVGRAACYRASPVIVKLEPQISYANDVACKILITHNRSIKSGLINKIFYVVI
uniref:Uncharacterized protein n=1 Tax=Maylandia zebra TaxID=106582 RepID=A0A3P9D8B4_9CICH